MAEALFRDWAPDIFVASAGTSALIGQPADAFACELVAARGHDLSTHRARQITETLCQRADIILAMDQAQCRHIETIYPLCRGKVFRLAEAARQDIPDPFRKGREASEQAFASIDAGVGAWAERLHKIQ